MRRCWGVVLCREGRGGFLASRVRFFLFFFMSVVEYCDLGFNMELAGDYKRKGKKYNRERS